MSPWSGAALSPLLNGQRTNNKRAACFQVPEHATRITLLATPLTVSLTLT